MRSYEILNTIPIKNFYFWIIRRLSVGAGEPSGGDFVLGERARIGAREAVRQRDAEGQRGGAIVVVGVEEGHNAPGGVKLAV